MGGLGGVVAGAVAKLGLWGAALLGGAVVTEQATDNGKGGAVSNFVPNVWKKWTETSSPEQGRNGLIDNFLGGNAKFASFMGFLSSIVSFFSPELSKKMDAWLIDRSKNISQLSRDFKETGDVNAEVLNPEAKAALNKTGQAANSFATTLEKAIPDSMDGGNKTVAAVEAGAAGLVGALALKRAFAPAATAAAAAPGGVLGKIATAAVLAGGAVAATSYVSGSSDTSDPANASAAPAASASTTIAAATTAAPASSNPVTGIPNTGAVSILENPAGFFNNLAEGTSSLVKTVNVNGKPETEINWSNVGTGLANNTKAAAGGLFTGTSWLVGQAIDILDTVDNVTGLRVIKDQDWSSVLSGETQKAYNKGLDAIGIGAPDMSGAWAQVAGFGGSLAAGGVVAKSIGLAGTIGNFVKWGSAGSAPAAPVAAAAAARPGILAP